MESEDDEIFDNIVCQEPLKYNNKEVFKIGHKPGVSQTKTPGFYPIEVNETKFYLIDCPGLNDMTKSKELGNQTAIHYILKNCKSFKLCIVISTNQIFTMHGQAFLQ